MKIAIIFPKDSEALFNKNSKRTFGGASVQMYLIVRELYNYKNIQTFSLIPNYAEIDFTDSNNFNLVKTFDEKDNIFLKIIKFRKDLQKIKPDVVIQHGLTLFSCLLARYCTRHGIRLVYMFASDIEVDGRYQQSQKKCLLFKMLINNTHRIIVQNEYQQQKLMYRGAQSVIIKNGFPVGKPIEYKDNYILWVGRSDKLKRPNLVIDFAVKNPTLRFIMICPISLSTARKQYEELKNKAQQLQNLKFIEFVGFADIDEYFRKAKIFINTSDYEGFPQTFIQAAIGGSPIISLNVDPENFIASRKCGFFCNGDIDLMEKKIKLLMANNRLYNEISRNIHRYAVENHNIIKNVRKLVDIIV